MEMSSLVVRKSYRFLMMVLVMDVDILSGLFSHSFDISKSNHHIIQVLMHFLILVFRLRKLLISTVLCLYALHLCTFRSLSFSVCFIAQGPIDVLWDFRPSFFGFMPLW